MAIDIGTLFVKLALESTEFIGGMKAAAAQSAATNKAIEKAFGQAKTALKGYIGLLTVDAFASATKAAFDYADAIVDLADRTGATTKSVQEMRYAAQLTGSDFATADTALEKFAKSLGSAQNGNEGLRKTFAALGVTSTNFDEALRQTADGISRLPTVTQRNATALTVFGKSAASLTLLMGEGSKGFRELAEDADQLGIVMGDDLLRNAGQVNDRLDQLKMIVDAQMSSAIVQNADAIAGLAESLIKVVSALAQFWSQNPTTAMALLGAGGGALAGGAIGGLPGALIGGGAGAIGGALLGYSSRPERKKLTDENASLQASFGDNPIFAAIGIHTPILTRDSPEGKRRLAKIAANNARLKELDRQEAAAADLLKSGNKGGTLAAPRAPKSSGKDAAKEAAARDARFASERDAAQIDLLSAQQDLTADIIEQSALEREILSIQTKRNKDSIDQSVASGQLTAQQGEALKLMEDQIEAHRADLINRRENEQIKRDELSIAQAANDNSRDLLTSEMALARTANERRAVALRLIDLQYQQERLALDAVLASKQSTDAEKQIAQSRLGILDQLRAGSIAQANRENAGPLAQYADSIPQTRDQINEALQGAAVDGLGALNDGLRDAIKGTGNLGDAFEAVGDRIIDKLLDIALQQAILKPLGSLFGSALSAIGGGLFGGAGAGGDIVIGSSYSSWIGGARANGGLTRAGTYLVGERGSELVTIGNTSHVTPNHAIRGIRGAANGGPVFNFGPITSNDPAMVRLMVMQGIAQASPMLARNGANSTISTLRRPTL